MKDNECKTYKGGCIDQRPQRKFKPTQEGTELVLEAGIRSMAHAITGKYPGQEREYDKSAQSFVFKSGLGAAKHALEVAAQQGFKLDINKNRGKFRP